LALLCKSMVIEKKKRRNEPTNQQTNNRRWWLLSHPHLRRAMREEELNCFSSVPFKPQREHWILLIAALFCKIKTYYLIVYHNLLLIARLLLHQPFAPFFFIIIMNFFTFLHWVIDFNFFYLITSISFKIIHGVISFDFYHFSIIWWCWMLKSTSTKEKIPSKIIFYPKKFELPLVKKS